MNKVQTRKSTINFAKIMAETEAKIHAYKMTAAPKRKIVTSCRNPLTRHTATQRGFHITVELECGHLDTVNATELRLGKVYCFKCFYEARKNK